VVDLAAIPRPLETYPSAADQSLAGELAARVRLEPFNALATGVFLLAIVHTFAAARFAEAQHHSALIPANFTTLLHFSVSSAIIFPKSAGDIGAGTTPSSLKRAFILGSASPDFSPYVRIVDACCARAGQFLRVTGAGGVGRTRAGLGFF